MYGGSARLPDSGLTSLGLNGRDRDGIDDVIRRAATRKIVAGAIEALKDRSDRRTARKAFSKFVGDIARIEIGEDEHVCAARDWRARGLGVCHTLDQGRISLQFSVDRKIWHSRLDCPGRLDHLVDHGVLC